MKTLLWLDDYRDPNTNEWLNFSPIPQPLMTVWVKSYDEFTKWIETYGLPDAICFDYDLGKNSDAPELTGCDCAKWLVKYCYRSGKPIPPYNMQSGDPEGKANIKQALDKYSRSFGEITPDEVYWRDEYLKSKGII